METVIELSKQYTLKQKAYGVDFTKIQEGYLSSGEDCIAVSRNKAKSILLGKIRWEDWKLKNGDEVTYLNIPVKRNRLLDLYEFEGGNIPLYKITEILKERKRIEVLNDILNNDSIRYCYIMKNGSYYRPDCSGYTSFKIRAGIYTKQEAVDHAKSCSELYVIAINIEEHNIEINKEIDEMKSRIISDLIETNI